MEPIHAEARRADLMHVVLNLVINARDALIDETGEISVELDTVPASQVQAEPLPLAVGAITPGINYARLRVTDNGRGMTVEDIPSRFDRSLIKTEPNSGVIGLAVISEIVLRAGGAVRVFSTVGKGSVFEVLWPCSAKLSPEKSDPMTGDCQFLQDAAILVVDDMSDVSEAFEAMLEGTGAYVAACTDPADALLAITKDPDVWTLLVTDFDMKRVDVAELLRKCRSLRPDLPVLLCTALPHGARQAADNSLVDGILVKPFSKDELINSATLAIARHDMEVRQRQ
jgi:CheY-like chemotaxis protein